MVSGGVRKSGNHHRNYQPSERPIGLLAVARHTRAGRSHSIKDMLWVRFCRSGNYFLFSSM